MDEYDEVMSDVLDEFNAWHDAGEQRRREAPTCS